MLFHEYINLDFEPKVEEELRNFRKKNPDKLDSNEPPGETIEISTTKSEEATAKLQMEIELRLAIMCDIVLRERNKVGDEEERQKVLEMLEQ